MTESIQCDCQWGTATPSELPSHRCPREAEIFYLIRCTPGRRDTMEVARRLGRDLYSSARCAAHPRKTAPLFEVQEISRDEYLVAEVMES